MKQTVTENAVIQRINRKLAPQRRQLKRCQYDSGAYNELGRFYIVCDNIVESMHVDLEELARETEVLKPSETLEI